MANCLSGKNKSQKKIRLYTPKQINRIHKKMGGLEHKLEPFVKWEQPTENDSLFKKITYWIIFGLHLPWLLVVEVAKWQASCVAINYTFADLFEDAFSDLFGKAFGFEAEFTIKEFGIPWLDNFLNTVISTFPVFDLPPHQKLYTVFCYTILGIGLIEFSFLAIKSITKTLLCKYFWSGVHVVLAALKKCFSFVCLTIALASAIIHSFYCFEASVSYYLNTAISFAILLVVVFYLRPEKFIESLAYSKVCASEAGSEFRSNLEHDNISTIGKACQNSNSSYEHKQANKQFSNQLSKSALGYSLAFSILTIAIALIYSWMGKDVVRGVSAALTFPTLLVRWAGRIVPMIDTYISQTYYPLKKHPK